MIEHFAAVATIDLTSITLGALLAAIVQAVVILGERWLASWRGEFRGTWYEIVPAWRDQPERIDRLKVRQRGQRITVSAQRLRPGGAEQGRRWRMTGYVHGNVLVGIFHITTPNVDASSFGTFTLHRDSSVKESSVWRGTYVRPDSEPLEVIVAGNQPQRPIVWQRAHPDQRPYR